MPNKAKKFNFLSNFQSFDLIWLVIQKIKNNLQKWENATSNGMFKIQEGIKKYCLSFLSIFILNKKLQKTMFFVIFSKMVIFGQNLTLLMCSL